MRVNLLDMHAAERAGMGPEWQPYIYQALDGPDYPSMLTGAVAPIITRGKNKGHRNWKKRDAATERRIVILRSEHTAWCEAWSKRNGKCAECTGEGQVMTGWSRDSGARYAPCKVCAGTGKREEADRG